MPRSRSRALTQIATTSGRHWRTADAEAVLQRLDASGLSIRAFARREGLNVQRLYRWESRSYLVRQHLLSQCRRVLHSRMQLDFMNRRK
jgi:DNA-binding transcriptional regulator YiaG